MFRQVTTEKIDVAAVSNTDQKVNDKKCVPKNVMSATFLCYVHNTNFCLQNHWNEVLWNLCLTVEKFNYCHVLKAQLF